MNIWIENVTIGYALTLPILEHNSNNTNEPDKMNGNSYHKANSYPFVNA